MMKKIIVNFSFLLLVLTSIHAQNEKTEFLKGPSTWQFERFALPPSFSTNFPYKGVEELRFSPGMFNKDSSDYFSYAFVAQLDNTSSITQSQVKNYLLTYFKGLCGSTAKERKLSIDTSQLNVSIEKKNSNATVYNATLHVFGVFADGAPVMLNAEVKVLNDVKAKKAYLVFIASPREKTDSIWQQLYSIQNGFAINN